MLEIWCNLKKYYDNDEVWIILCEAHQILTLTKY